ncbi:MAG: NosD domain-containing protein [Pseudomonadota bacterium]
MNRLVKAAVSGSLLLCASVAGAQACTVIDTAPVVIDQPGHYCLDANLAVPSMPYGSAIIIQANHVTLDCRHHAIIGSTAEGNGSAQGIGAIRGRNSNNLAVRNCVVRGLPAGISVGTHGTVFVPPLGVVIENNHLDGGGIGVHAEGGVIRGNTLVRNLYGAISIRGNVDVIDNTVDGVYDPEGGARAIFVLESQGSVISGNRIRNVGGAYGDSFGIVTSYFQDSNALSLRDNVVTNAGQTQGAAVLCNPGGSAGYEIATGNLWLGFATGQSNCVDGGGNRALEAPVRQVGGETSKRLGARAAN